jgi:DNA processing protein
MSEFLTPNTKAILLLTAPLIVGRNEGSRELLSLGDYNRLARILKENQKQPADLIGVDAQNLLPLCAQRFARTRLDALLERGFLLSQAVERWRSRAIWVVSRADSSYPKRLKARLREDAPPVLYGCGSAGLLEDGGLAVVGSRHIDDELIAYTENVGRVSAEAGQMIISGGAKGIDRAAMNGALEAGGKVSGVLADSLERAAIARENREPILDRRLVLISPYDPAAGFNVGHAMHRNKLIYALADVGLVVTSDFAQGGTWAGAIEQLEKLHFVPLFARNGANVGKGNAALIERGALRWPEPRNGPELDSALNAASAAASAKPKQDSLQFSVQEAPGRALITNNNSGDSAETGIVAAESVFHTPTKELFGAVKKIVCRELESELTGDDLANLLGVNKAQAKSWIDALVKEGALEKVKKSKPARYRTIRAEDRLL